MSYTFWGWSTMIFRINTVVFLSPSMGQHPFIFKHYRRKTSISSSKEVWNDSLSNEWELEPNLWINFVDDPHILTKYDWKDEEIKERFFYRPTHPRLLAMLRTFCDLDGEVEIGYEIRDSWERSIFAKQKEADLRLHLISREGFGNIPSIKERIFPFFQYFDIDAYSLLAHQILQLRKHIELFDAFDKIRTLEKEDPICIRKEEKKVLWNNLMSKRWEIAVESKLFQRIEPLLSEMQGPKAGDIKFLSTEIYEWIMAFYLEYYKDLMPFYSPDPNRSQVFENPPKMKKRRSSNFDYSETEEDRPDEDEYFHQDQKEYFETTKYFQNQDSDTTQEGTQNYGHLWVQCDNCYELNYRKYFYQNHLNICEHCGFHLKMSSSERIELPVDQGTWNPMDEDMISTDPIEFDRNPTEEVWPKYGAPDPNEWKETPIQINRDTGTIQYKRDMERLSKLSRAGDTDSSELNGAPVKTDAIPTPVKPEDPLWIPDKPEEPIWIPIPDNGAPFKIVSPQEEADSKKNEDSHSGIQCEDSKNPIAFNWTNYAGGIDFESESKEENSKEEGVSEDCIDLEFESEEKDYKDRLDSYQEETGLTEAVQTGTGQLNGIPVAIGVMDFQFIGGSMGSVVGEKITRLIEYASKKGLPLILVCASGGARMQEGSLSLMQMAKISAALHKHQTNKKLLYISMLTSPTTGGVTASFGMLGDIIITEPDADIAFAGKRVIEQTLNLTVPEDLQTSEYLFQKGLFDLIIPRNLLKNVLSELLKLHAVVPSAQIVK